ncbi:MAG: ComF family protein [Bacteroidetes bacterium]|nr:ComF family protein [Bacteroidota bacterium]
MNFQILKDISRLFFPVICPGCGNEMFSQKSYLCLKCITKLPHTGFAEFSQNPVEKMFYGRIPLLAAHSEFYFTKDSVIQNLIHQLKYKGNIDIGYYLGNLLGESLLKSGRFKEFDYLVPLPLHKKKQFLRGYNQAEIICKGISETTQIPLLTKKITREKQTSTQTRKHRTERWKNVEGSFYINEPETIYNKKIILVDDVITTGATLEACGTNILQIEGAALGIASLAYATK